VIEAYAITDGTPSLPDAALRMLPCGTLRVIWGPAGEGPVDADALWRREALVEALTERCDLLPIRYGARFAGEEELARAVTVRAGELTLALDRIRGAVELSVRVHDAVARSLSQDDAEPAAGGGAALRARARVAARAEQVATIADDALRPLARESLRRATSGPSEALRAAYLVDRGTVEAFGASVARLEEAHPELQILCTGPWPPYSFAEQRATEP
jgi:hypothetical protein